MKKQGNGIVAVFVAMLGAIVVQMFVAGCAGTAVQTTVKTRYGNFTYDSKDAGK